MFKRAQAALEFLTTYGWAFLVILVMIGALAYFGVLNPQKFLPERCQFGSEFKCKDYRVVRDTDGASAGVLNGNVSMDVVTAIGKTIDPVIKVNASSETKNLGYVDEKTCKATHQDGTSVTAYQPGDTIRVTCNLTMAKLPPVGDKIRVGLDVTWKELGGSFGHKTSGEVYANVQ
jgi:hypothetical protein